MGRKNGKNKIWVGETVRITWQNMDSRNGKNKMWVRETVKIKCG
jgi:hypothetical protein